MIPTTLLKWLIRSGAARYIPALRRRAGGSEAFAHYYSDRILAAPVERLRDSATFPLTPFGTTIDLNSATPQLDAPASYARPAGDRNRPIAGGLPALKRIVAERESERGRPTDADSEVVITAGATAGYAAICEAFLNPGDRVVVFDPSSPLFSLGAQSRRATVRTVPTELVDGGMTYDPDALSRALRGAKLLAIADPCNPTGASLNAAQLEHLVWAAKRSDVLIVLDESFDRFRYEGKPSSLPTLAGATERTLRLNSASAAYGLASARVGWVCGSVHLVKAVGLAALLSCPFVPTASQRVALAQLSDEDEERFGPEQQELRSRRNYAVDRLKALGFAVTIPTAGFFLWLDVSVFGIDGRRFAAELLAQTDVLVGPGFAFGASGTNKIRLSYAIEDGRLREGLRRLATFVAGKRGEPLPTASVRREVVAAAEPAFSRV